jgi:hypothetical protein
MLQSASVISSDGGSRSPWSELTGAIILDFSDAPYQNYK